MAVSVAGLAVLMYRLDLVEAVSLVPVQCLLYTFVALFVTGTIAACLTAPAWLLVPLRLPAVVWLGRISFGLYVYHSISLTLVDQIAGSHGISFHGMRNLTALTAAAFVATIAVAAVSYLALERPFLLLKKRWARIQSRPV